MNRRKDKEKKNLDSGIEHPTSFLASKVVVQWSKRLSPILEVWCLIPLPCFFFFIVLSSIYFVCFHLLVLFCFIYNIYRTTYLREIIFPCTTHNERSSFLFQYLTNYLSLKLRTNENNERWGALLWTERASIFCLRSHRDPFAFFIALARLSVQKINDISSTT